MARTGNRVPAPPLAHSGFQGRDRRAAAVTPLGGDWDGPIIWSRPFPLPDFGHVLAVLVDVLLVLDELVLHHVLQVATS